MLYPSAILLSKFNGERFLCAMIDSLDQQLDAKSLLYWRDDGSTESTVKIVRGYRGSIDMREISETERIGACASFLALLCAAVPHSTCII